MRKEILVIAHFCSDFNGKGNNRFNFLFDLFEEKKIDVELVTSDFSHIEKKKRGKLENHHKHRKITFIQEPNYSKNVSLKRLYSHYTIGKNLKKYLTTRKKPDIIYCAVPSLAMAKAAAEYANKNNIKFIIDVQDLWPEVFKMVFRIPYINDFLFYPIQQQANKIYATADEIVAVSDTYVKKAMSVNNKCRLGHSVYLGTDLLFFDKLAKKNNFIAKPDDEIWITYIGTLGHSYDLMSVIEALKLLNCQGINSIKLVVIGDGPLRLKFEKYAKKQEINYQFTGKLDYGKMVGLLTSCDIAVNPIKKGSAGSIINKVGDYAAAGLPVVNTQESIEYRNLINEYEAGFNCANGNPKELASSLLKLYLDKELRKKMGKNNRILAEEKFDRKKTYQKIVELME